MTFVCFYLQFTGRFADSIRAAHFGRNSRRRHAGEGNAAQRCGVQGNRREAGARLRKRGTLVEHGRDAQWALVHPFADVSAF
jgi:hypothetical protein